MPRTRQIILEASRLRAVFRVLLALRISLVRLVFLVDHGGRLGAEVDVGPGFIGGGFFRIGPQVEVRL